MIYWMLLYLLICFKLFIFVDVVGGSGGLSLHVCRGGDEKGVREERISVTAV